MQAYQDMVYTTVVRLTGNDTQAEDLTQEVFLRAYEQFAALRTSSTAGGWLKTVATNSTLNYLTRQRRRWRLFSELRATQDDDDADFDIAVPDTVLDQLQASERHALVEQSLRTLPDQQRIPLVLYHFEDMSYEQIAAQLQISLAKTKVDIHRARIALARLLARKGWQSQDGKP